MTEPFSLVLLGLRVRGLASAAAVAEVAGLAVSVVVGHLEHCRRNDWATFRDGRLAGWALTPLGRVEGERRLAEELDALGARSRVEADYGRFLALNATLLQVCAFWQLREGEWPNDHSDAAYDAAVLRCLIAFHNSALPLVGHLGDSVPRLQPYVGRIEAALAHVVAGDVDWFTGVRPDSYHMVWFELHENLLATLGRARSAEGV